MTTDASRVRDVVVSVDVTLAALYTRVRTGKRESSLGVIEGCRRPRRRAVTNFAGLRNSRSHVIRIVGSLEILQVA